MSEAPNVALALHEAVSAIYFGDSSDYLQALWNVVSALSPETAELLESDEHAAYDQTDHAAHPERFADDAT